MSGTKINQVVDTFLGKLISRKLTVFIIATIFLALSTKISGEEWVNIAMIYIGTQAVIDAIVKIRNGNTNEINQEF